MDSYKKIILAIAITVLVMASFPILYPLSVAAAACCERRLPRDDARVAGLVIILAILAGTSSAQLGLLPVVGPQPLGDSPSWSLWSSWGLALASAVGVWAVVARIGCWQEAEARQPVGNDAGRRAESSDFFAINQSVADPEGGAAAAAGVRFDSGESTSHWDRPTQISSPAQRSHGSHLTYDVDAKSVLADMLQRTPVEKFHRELLAAGLSTIDVSTLPRPEGVSTGDFVQRLIDEDKVTPYQVVMICAGFAALLRIDEFEVLDRLGRGGMAIVLRVRHTVTRHLYALKLLKELDPIDPASRNRFLREMEAVCGLAHPNIAVAHSVGHQGNRLHIAMELVEGQNLAELVANQGPLAPGQALGFAAQAARALAHAHERGLVHRDVKPGNLMVGPRDQIKLVDMGLARFIDVIEARLPSQGDAWHTMTGHLIGTIDYMAPEQAEELATSDRRSDIYSLGCTLFFLLTGESHLRGRSQRRRAISLVSRRGITELRAVRDNLPECLYALADRMTELDPDARFQTMAEVIQAMDQCARDLGVGTPSDRRFRVLMVEDSLTQSIAMRHQLEATSPHVDIQTVTTLEAAVSACRRDLFDIVLLDLNLPDSTGLATVKQFRRAEELTPILVMTSSNDAELGLACIHAGADDFLPKHEIEPGMLQRHILLTIGRQRGGTSGVVTPVEARA